MGGERYLYSRLKHGAIALLFVGSWVSFWIEIVTPGLVHFFFSFQNWQFAHF